MRAVITLQFITMLCFFSLNTLGAQSIVWETMTVDNVIAASSGQNITITFTNGTPALNGGELEVQLGTGMQYIPNSVNNATDADISNLNRPTFSLNNIPANTLVTITLDQTGSCDAVDHKINAGNFTVEAEIYKSGVQIGDTSPSIPYDLLYASLSINNPSTTPATAQPGETVNRGMYITNAGQGYLSEFYFSDIINTTDATISNVRINPNGINYAVPSGNISISNDSLIIHFDSNIITEISSVNPTDNIVDELFENDEIFRLSYDILVNTCGNATNNIPSNLVSWWGFDDGICQKSTDNTQNISIPTLVPTLTTSSTITEEKCFSTPSNRTITINNTGSATASNIEINVGLGVHNYITTYSSWIDNTSFYYTIDGGSSIPISPTTVQTTTHSCPPSNASTRVTFTIPTLEGGQTAVISWEAISCCNDDCTGNMNTKGAWVYEFTYQDACGSANYSTGLKYGGGQDYWTMDYIVDSPTTVNGGETFSMEFFNTTFHTVLRFNEAPGYLEMRVNLNPSIIFSGNISDVEFYDKNGVQHTPDYLDYTNDVVTLRWNAPFLSTQLMRKSALYLQLTADCSVSGGTQVVDYEMKYVRDPSCLTCGYPAVCFPKTIDVLCPGPCPDGIQFNNYTIQRTNLGLPDNDNDGIADNSGSLDMNKVKANRFVIGDTLQAVYEGTIYASTFPSFDYAYAKAIVGNGSYISDLGYEVIIEKYISPGVYTTYTCTGLNATVSNITGERTFTYDASVATLIATGCLPNGFTYENLDKITVKADYIADGHTNSGKELTFGTEFFTSNIADPTDSSDKYQCIPRSGSMNYLRVYNTISGPQNINADGCGEILLTHSSYLSIGECCTNYAGGNLFPFEFRNFQTVEKHISTFPDGFILTSVDLFFYRTQGYSKQTTNLSNVSYTQVGNTITIDIQALFDDGTLPLPDEGFQLTQALHLLPSCDVLVETPLPSEYIFSYTNIPQWADIWGPTSTTSHLLSANQDRVTYKAPQLNLNSPFPIQEGTTENVSWDIDISNLSNASDAGNVWIGFNNPSGDINITQVQNITDGATLTASTGGLYLIGDVLKTNTKTIRVEASYSSCNLDNIEVFTGWTCDVFDDNMTLANANCSTGPLTLTLDPKPAQIQTSLTELMNTPVNPSNPSGSTWGSSNIVMCEAFPVEFSINSTQPGTIYDIVSRLTVPSNSGNAGLTYVPNSGTIEFPEGTAPRSFDLAGENALTAANGGILFDFDLALIDAANFGGLEGTTDLTRNEAVIRFQMLPTCDLVSGSYPNLKTFATTSCGQVALGNGENINFYAISIDGVTSPYQTSISGTIADMVDCSNQAAIFDITKIGLTAINTEDSIQVILPDGINYEGNYSCTSTHCPIGNPVETSIGGQTILTWEIPQSLNASGGNGNGETITLSLEISADPGYCAAATAIETRTVSTATIYCSSSGSNCPASTIATGASLTSIAINKPILDIDFTTLNAPGQGPTYDYHYSLEINNTGVSTNRNTNIDFYCANAAGDDIVGNVLHTHTITNQIDNGGKETISGTVANCNCDPQSSIIAVIDLDNSNCFCNDITGLEQVHPFTAGKDRTLPVELMYFESEVDECDVTLRWATASEENSDYFIVERSTNGISFEAISPIINAAGFSNENNYYQYQDKNVRGTHFYRLKEVDLDGTEELFEVATVTTDCEKLEGFYLNLYPNPARANKEINLTYNVLNDTNMDIDIFDVYGKKIYSLSQEVFTGSGNIPINDLEKSSSGIYFLHIHFSHNNSYEVIKLHILED